MPKYKKNHLKQAIIRAMTTIGAISFMIFLVVFLANGNQKSQNDNLDNHKRLSEQVKEYQPLVEETLKQYDKGEYTGVVLALMMQESGGRGNDPMQSSESFCGEVGCINDPTVSIEEGVKYFSQVLDKSNGDVKLALQSYNFGAGFINYVQEHGGNYTENLAIEFSQEKYAELKETGIYSCIREEAKQYDACYGDILYVQAVLDYYPDAVTYAGDEVQVALVN
ncbi:lysozyme family protein [Aquibacillus rhizosphaerae]|uniref:Lysozyme family protein n=1 Tax=Aquibacillus rhizosphaerae TaxID=3051431 RepID=A0ABT7L5K4_9BACI|nr:lysozyme family protein [Aquibacillus sp. LR5S19]MDL4841152.1 lysozyme family protein [Aquibacillus sp. LR5S19]